MHFVDSHCHLHDPKIIELGINKIIQNAKTAKVKYMATCSTIEDDFKLTLKLSKDFSCIIPCFGIHPWFLETLSEKWKENLEYYLLKYPCAIGETGLDFADKQMDRDLQIKVFKHHLMLAKELKIPINIHIRKAWDTFIDIIKKFGKLDGKGLIHSYSGSVETIKILEKYGFYFSFSGSIANFKNKRSLNSFKNVPKNCFVFETDSPYMLPKFLAKQNKNINEPSFLPDIAKIAFERLVLAQSDVFSSYKEFCDTALNNSLSLFDAVFKKREKQDETI